MAISLILCKVPFTLARLLMGFRRPEEEQACKGLRRVRHSLFSSTRGGTLALSGGFRIGAWINLASAESGWPYSVRNDAGKVGRWRDVNQIHSIVPLSARKIARRLWFESKGRGEEMALQSSFAKRRCFV